MGFFSRLFGGGKTVQTPLFEADPETGKFKTIAGKDAVYQGERLITDETRAQTQQEMSDRRRETAETYGREP